MRTPHSAVASLLVLVFALVSVPASAVSLRPGKATDQSVCDLGPNTTEVLARRILVPGRASSKDQIEAFFRLGAAFVSEQCSDGQLLILHGEAESRVDVGSLDQLANTSCVAAHVARTEVPFTYAGTARRGFELRCTISKLAALKATLAEHERLESLDSLVARMAGTGRSEPVPSPGAQGSSDKKDCGKMTLSSVLVGGNCR